MFRLAPWTSLLDESPRERQNAPGGFTWARLSEVLVGRFDGGGGMPNEALRGVD